MANVDEFGSIVDEVVKVMVDKSSKKDLKDDLKCLTCKATALGLKTVFGNPYSLWLENEIFKFLCRPYARFV